MARATRPCLVTSKCSFVIYKTPYSAYHAFIKISKRTSSHKTNHPKSPFTDQPTMHDNEDFYRFTRGRFVQNEAYEMASRYVRFDVDELGKAAADAVGSKSCANIEKFADGMHNKALLLTMDDGRQVVAKIPNPNAGEPHFTTASEVATMELMGDVLETPVPKVYAWCSHAEDTPVGAEYIIMEKAAGVSLNSVWHKLELANKFAIAKQIAQFQAAWSSTSYAGYGSVYYAADLSEQLCLPINLGRHSTATDKKFALGPITGRNWNDDGRQFVTFDRGPWRTLEEYLEATGLREMACVKELARLPPAPITLCGPGTYQPTREKKLRALEYYLQLYKHVAPTDAAVRKPSAWHGDLHVENIYVDPSEPTKVACIIDWQSTEVAPLFVQVRQPYILDHDGPQAPGLDRPHLPDNFAELSLEEQKAANRLLVCQSLCVAYKMWIQNRCPDIWKCFEYQETPASELLVLARALLVDGEAIYTGRIVELLQSGDSTLKNSDLSILEDLVAEIEADAEGALRGMEAMTNLQETIGDLFPEGGCVRAEQYDEAKDALRQCKGQIIDMFAKTDAERAAWDELWPFDD